MSNIGINIMLQALGVPQTRQDIESVGTSGKAMGNTIKAAGEQAKKGLDAAGDGAKQVEKELRNAEGAAGIFQKRVEGIGSLGGKLSGFADWVGNYTQGWQDAAAAQGKAEGRIEAILKAQGRLNDLTRQTAIIQDIAAKGHYPDVNNLREAAAILDTFKVKTSDLNALLAGVAVQSRAIGKDIGEGAEAFGEAYATGEVGSLNEYGLPIDADKAQQISEAYARSAAEGQALFMQVVGEAIRKTSGELGSGIDANTAKLNDAARNAQALSEALGRGSQTAQANLTGVNSRLVEMANLAPASAEKIGEVSTYAGAAAQSLGGLAQTGLTTFQALTDIAGHYGVGITGIFGAMRASFILHTSAMWSSFITWATAGTAAATAAVGPMLLLAGAALAAVAAIGLAAYSWNVNKDKILNPTQSYEDNRTGDQVREDRRTEWQVDAFSNRASNLNDRDRYVALRAITQKYMDLNLTDKASATAEEANKLRQSLGQNYKDAVSTDGKALLSEIQALRADTNKAAQLDGSNYKGYQEHDFFGNVKQPGSSGDITSQASKLQAQLDALKAGSVGAPAMPPMAGGVVQVAPSGLSGTLLPAMASQYGMSGYGPAAIVPTGLASHLSESRGAVQRIELEIAALEEQLENAKLSRKPIIQKQIGEAKKRLEAARKQLAADERASGADIELQGFAFDLRRVKAENRYNEQIAALEDERDRAKKDGDAARVEALTKQIEVAKATRDRDARLIEAANVRLRDVARAQSMTDIANEMFGFDLRMADRTARKEGEGARGTKWHDMMVRAELFGQQGYGWRRFNRGSGAAGGFADMNRESNEFSVGNTVKYNTRGDFIVKFEDVTIPNQSIGTQRGRRPR